MASQIERVNVVVVAQSAGNPVPAAGVIESAVDENQRRLVVFTVVPKLQLQAVRIEEVRDRFVAQKAPPAAFNRRIPRNQRS
jgi:hypothetical protein